MARLSPAEKLVRINVVTYAWRKVAPLATFFGKTLEQFMAAVKPSLDARDEIEDLQRRLRIAIQRRDRADARSLRLITNVGFGVKGDPAHGNNSALLSAMGYTPEIERRRRIRSGKRRMKKARAR